MINWDFKNSNTGTATHAFHTYPAKMIPQVAQALITEYGQNSKLLFDPYCGTGTSLVEANIKGINSIGCDLNPFARLLAKVKTTPIELQSLELHIKDFYDFLYQYRLGFKSNNSVIVPDFKRINFWFSKPVKEKLSIIKYYIENIENKDIADFFKVAFSQTIRNCSWTRKNEFKLYRMSPEQIKSFKPDPFGVFESILGKNFIGLEEFMSLKRNKSETKILSWNTVNEIPRKLISSNSVDLIVTSPPYGDSSTTVAYGQFSALSNQWLGLMQNGRTLDSELMGGRKVKFHSNFKSEVLNENVLSVARLDEKRACDVTSFYEDYNNSIKNISNIVKPKGIVCFVVSNRSVKGIRMSTDIITKDFFTNYGFNHLGTFNRKISSKRMPRNNSSVGKSGIKTSLMNTESIVIMQKK